VKPSLINRFGQESVSLEATPTLCSVLGASELMTQSYLLTKFWVKNKTQRVFKTHRVYVTKSEALDKSTISEAFDKYNQNSKKKAI